MPGRNSKGQCAHRGKEWTGSSDRNRHAVSRCAHRQLINTRWSGGECFACPRQIQRVFPLSDTGTASVSPVRYTYSECFPCPIHMQRVFPLFVTDTVSFSPVRYTYSECFPCPIHMQRVFPLFDTDTVSFFPYPIYIQQVFPRSDTRTVSISHISDIDAVSVSPIDLQSEVYVRYSRVNSSGVCKVQPSEQFWCM